MVSDRSICSLLSVEKSQRAKIRSAAAPRSINAPPHAASGGGLDGHLNPAALLSALGSAPRARSAPQRSPLNPVHLVRLLAVQEAIRRGVLAGSSKGFGVIDSQRLVSSSSCPVRLQTG